MAQQQGDFAEYNRLLTEDVPEHNRMFPESRIDNDDIDRSEKIRRDINERRILGMVADKPDLWRREMEEMGIGDVVTW